MRALIILSILIIAVHAQRDIDYAPIPYSFNYVSTGEDGGSSSHQEQGDGSGRVQGSYSVNDVEGFSRLVEYTADENGFRAVVKTNEPGTANQNPADVVIESSADGAQPAVRSAQPVAQPRPRPVAPRPVAPQPAAPATQSGAVRYVLVPESDPRARAPGAIPYQ